MVDRRIGPGEPDFYSGIKDSGNTFMCREEVFERLEASGIDRAVVEFSGGYDEGGSDAIYLMKKVEMKKVEMKKVETKKTTEEETSEESEGRVAELREHVWPAAGRELSVAQKDEMRLAQSLTAPIYDSYSSFAGDFHVDGAVEWIVEGRRVVMNGQETVEHLEDIETEL